MKKYTSLLSFTLIMICVLFFYNKTASGGTRALLPDPNRLNYKPLSFTPQNPQRVRLQNGLVLYILTDRELPLVKVKAVIRTGSMYDPEGKEGLSELTAELIGTGGFSGMGGDAVDEALEAIAANLHSAVDRESAMLSFSTLKKDLERGFNLFSGMLTDPIFEERKINQAKELKLEELRRIIDDPQKIAFREFGRLMHEGSPRGRLTTSASIQSIKREDLIDNHKYFYSPDNIIIAISGDIDVGEVLTLAEKNFGGWRPAERKHDAPSIPVRNEGGIYFLVKDVPQSIVIFGSNAPAKKDARFYTFEIINFILGNGGFRSRIFQEIRTNLGLAYSTGSFYNARSEYGIFGAYAFTKSESTVRVVNRLQELLQEIGRQPVSPAEIEGAKRSMHNSYIFSFTSAEQIAFKRLMIEYEDLPSDHMITYLPRIDTVSRDDIREVASNVFQRRPVLLILGNEQVYREVSSKFENVIRIEPRF